MNIDEEIRRRAFDYAKERSQQLIDPIPTILDIHREILKAWETGFMAGTAVATRRETRSNEDLI